MFACMKNKALQMALNGIKEKFVNPNIEGIATVKEMCWKDKTLYLLLVLNGLEDHPIEVTASDIKIAPDCSSITIGSYDSNMPFAYNALNQFGKSPIAIPEGNARMGLKMAKSALGL